MKTETEENPEIAFQFSRKSPSHDVVSEKAIFVLRQVLRLLWLLNTGSPLFSETFRSRRFFSREPGHYKKVITFSFFLSVSFITWDSGRDEVGVPA